MQIGTYGGKLVEEVGGAYERVVFLKVLNDEDKDKCPNWGKQVPTEIVSVVSSPNHQSRIKGVLPLTI